MPDPATIIVIDGHSLLLLGLLLAAAYLVYRLAILLFWLAVLAWRTLIR